MKLLRKTGPLQFEAKVNDKELVLDVNDQIGGDFFGEGITAQTVTDALKAQHDRVTLNINSPGGDPFDGVAIFNVLKANGKPVTVNVTGMAASAATIVALAGDTVNMGEGTFYMIHNAKAITFGDAAELRNTADLVEKISGSMAAMYAKFSGQDQKDVQTWMDGETWMTAQEAVDRGFATKISGQKVKAKADFDLSMFSHVPDALKAKVEEAPAPVVETPAPVEVKAEVTEFKTDDEAAKNDLDLKRKRIKIARNR
jgi:ATP-dependent protease ClpP protease subunit